MEGRAFTSLEAMYQQEVLFTCLSVLLECKGYVFLPVSRSLAVVQRALYEQEMLLIFRADV